MNKDSETPIKRGNKINEAKGMREKQRKIASDILGVCRENNLSFNEINQCLGLAIRLAESACHL